MNAQMNIGTVFSSWMAKYGTRRALRRATVNAHAKFAARYPQYAAALFDEHFLANRAADLLERYITSDDPPKSVELARAWAEQIHMREDTKVALVSELTPVASKFLLIFETDLVGRDWVGTRAALSSTSYRMDPMHTSDLAVACSFRHETSVGVDRERP